MSDMAEILGDRPAAMARELTKLYEEVRRGTLTDLARHFTDNGPPKGEIVIVVGPPEKKSALTEAELDNMIREHLEQQSVKDTAAAIATLTGLPKKKIYARAVELSHDEK